MKTHQIFFEVHILTSFNMVMNFFGGGDLIYSFHPLWSLQDYTSQRVRYGRGERPLSGWEDSYTASLRATRFLDLQGSLWCSEKAANFEI